MKQVDEEAIDWGTDQDAIDNAIKYAKENGLDEIEFSDRKYREIEDLFPFAESEKVLVEQLLCGLRCLLQEASGNAIESLGLMIFGLERVPSCDPEFYAKLSLVDCVDEDGAILSVEIDGSTFRLSAEGPAGSSYAGSESFPDAGFEIVAGEGRFGTSGNFRNWLAAFKSSRWKIVDSEDDPYHAGKPPTADGWERLKRFGISEGEESCKWIVIEWDSDD